MKKTAQSSSVISTSDSALLDDLQILGRVVRSKGAAADPSPALDMQVTRRQAAWFAGKVVAGRVNGWNSESLDMATRLRELNTRDPRGPSNGVRLIEIHTWLAALKRQADEPLNDSADTADLFAGEVIRFVTFFDGLSHLTTAR